MLRTYPKRPDNLPRNSEVVPLRITTLLLEPSLGPVDIWNEVIHP